MGPRLVRLLWQEGVPQGVRLADGGTAGMDVAFQMRGAARVVIVDAAATGAAPGTVYRVPGEELADLPPASGIHTHSFRWDHALAFARWLLGPHCPSDVTVFLVEVADVTHGADLSAPAQAGLETVAAMVRAEFFPRSRRPSRSPRRATCTSTRPWWSATSRPASSARWSSRTPSC
nr:hydrogenase maturation protease [Nocardioides humi]